MSLVRNFFYSFFFFLSILTLSFYVFRFLKYSFSIAFFLICIIIFLSIKYISLRSWILYLIILMHQFFVVLLFIFDIDFVEFIKSFLLVNISLLGIISSKFFIPNIFCAINFKKIITIAVIAIISFEFIQILEYNLYGTSFSWFIFDKFSISTAEDVGRFEAVNFLNYMRPISFYHEPSYLGLVLFCTLVWSEIIKLSLIIKSLIIIGIVLTFSTTIYLFMILYYFPKFYNNKYAKLFFSFLILYFIFKYNFIIFDFFRFNEIVTEGTSGYARIGAPFFQVLDILFNQNNFLGIPFGQSPIMFDNSFFVIFSYYGILTPFFYFVLFGSVFNNIKGFNKLYNYFIIIGACLFVNGAFFTPETCFLIILTNYFLINKFPSKNTNLIPI